MDLHLDEARDRAGATPGLQPDAPDAAGPAGGDPPAADPQTRHLMALEHLASGLRAICDHAAAVSWARMAACTLDAATYTSTSTTTTGDVLRRRMVLNHELDHAFAARNHRHPWTEYDSTTVLLAVDDLIAAEHTRPTPDA